MFLHAFEKVRHIPDIVFIDGHGLSHPRSAGIACHVGVCLDKPTIGGAGTFDGIVPSGIVRHIRRKRGACYFMVIGSARPVARPVHASFATGPCLAL